MSITNIIPTDTMPIMEICLKILNILEIVKKLSATIPNMATIMINTINIPYFLVILGIFIS